VTVNDGRPWPVLAALRFILSLVVVSGHLTLFIRPTHPLCVLGKLGGFPAVLGFLFVSGYSIAHSLDREPRGFYQRRVIRIYPLYLASIAVSLLPYFASGWQTIYGRSERFFCPTPAVVLQNVLMLQTYSCQPIESNPLVWTLAVEFSLYLAAPLLRRAGTRVTLGLAIASAAAFASYAQLKLDYFAHLRHGLPIAFLAWAWLTGFVYRPHRANRIATALMICLPAALVVRTNIYSGTLGVVTVAITAMTVAAAPRLPVPRGAQKPMRLAGDLSYPLYLFHLPAFLLCFCVDLFNPYALVALAVAVSAVALAADIAIRRLLVIARTPKRLIPTPG
jgi:peptidoglycan/LPS O-acetylase OafA/YrhL